MRNRTVERGATPAEAAAFAAKVAEMIEKYEIDEAELRSSTGHTTPSADDIEVCQNLLRTGKRVFNPGMTAVVSGLATGMCCRVILLHKNQEAVYGVVGDSVDADYVCQLATVVVPALQVMAKLEGAEYGYERAGLVQWTNQYLAGAGLEILRRIEADRKRRSEVKEADAKVCSTSLVVITGDSLAILKKQATEVAFKDMYPKTRTTRSRSEYNHSAQEAGREAGKRIGLGVPISGSRDVPRLS
jgi:hypothetical protein